MIYVKDRQELIAYYQDCFDTETQPSLKRLIANEIKKVQDTPDNDIERVIENFNKLQTMLEQRVDDAVQELFGAPKGETIQ